MKGVREDVLMILIKDQKIGWKDEKGRSLEQVLFEYGVDTEEVKNIVRGKEFVIKTKFNTLIKVERSNDRIKITPYFSEKDNIMKFVYTGGKLYPLSDAVKQYMCSRTGFLDIPKLEKDNLDYYIDVKEGLTLVGIINRIDSSKFKDINDFTKDIQQIESQCQINTLAGPNYLTVIKCYDDISLDRLKDKLLKARRYMKDLQIYQTGVYEFSLLSKFPVNNLITENLVVAFRSKPLTSFHSVEVSELRKELFREIVSNRNIEEENMVKGYFKALHHKTDETAEHSERMRRIVTLIGQELLLKDNEFETLWSMSTIHDVGKLAIEGKIINKPGKLTSEEFGIVKKHTILGYEMMAGIKSYEDSRVVCLMHHERWNGKGYPYQVGGEDIPTLVRVVSVADAIDAMASSRVYKSSYPFDYIKEELEKNQGVQFCPQIAKSALDIFEDIKRLY